MFSGNSGWCVGDGIVDSIYGMKDGAGAWGMDAAASCVLCVPCAVRALRHASYVQ